ncbi:MAG: hypothetical protein ACYCYM_08580 [Saccharofermentanales bacterium]
MVDKDRFVQTCALIMNTERGRAGIGTLGEKTLHAVLKHYYEPDETRHEIRLGRYVADILGENGVIEIQTRNFDKLRKKLEKFLAETSVTLVFPIPRTKWIFWIDGSTGEISVKRKSPKKGTPYQAYFELYKIRSLLLHPNLKICIVMLDVDEYRNLDGWSIDKKKGSSRFERIPVEIIDEITIGTIPDYARLIPENLPGLFTAKDFKKASGLSLSNAQKAVNILNFINYLERAGKIGKAFRYRTADTSCNCHPPAGIQQQESVV